MKGLVSLEVGAWGSMIWCWIGLTAIVVYIRLLFGRLFAERKPHSEDSQNYRNSYAVFLTVSHFWCLDGWLQSDTAFAKFASAYPGLTGLSLSYCPVDSASFISMSLRRGLWSFFILELLRKLGPQLVELRIPKCTRSVWLSDWVISHSSCINWLLPACWMNVAIWKFSISPRATSTILIGHTLTSEISLEGSKSRSRTYAVLFLVSEIDVQIQSFVANHPKLRRLYCSGNMINVYIQEKQVRHWLRFRVAYSLEWWNFQIEGHALSGRPRLLWVLASFAV